MSNDLNILVSRSYARAFYSLAKNNDLDKEISSLVNFIEVLNSSNDLELVLSLNIFQFQEKLDVLEKVLEKVQVTELVQNFLKFLLQEDRLNHLSQVYAEIIGTQDHELGFIRGVVEGANESIDPQVQAEFEKFINNRTGKKAKLSYVHRSDLTAGYKVRVEDLQFDTSAEKQFELFQEN